MYEALAWRGHTSQRTGTIDAFKKTIDEHKLKLIQYGKAMDFLQPHDSMSFEQWAEYVLTADKSIPEAEKYAGEYATKAPIPALHLLQPCMNIGSYQMLPSMFNILISENFTKEFLKKDILPRSLKKGQETIDGAKDSKNPMALAMAANDTNRLVGYALAVEKENATAKSLQTQAKGLLDKANAILAAQVAANRMPAEAYTGADLATLKTKLTELYTKAYPKEKVVKVVIMSSDWFQRAEAWWTGDVLHSGVFKIIHAAVATDKGDGKIRVFYEKFAREWTGTGDDYGAAYHCGTWVLATICSKRTCNTPALKIEEDALVHNLDEGVFSSK